MLPKRNFKRDLRSYYSRMHQYAENHATELYGNRYLSPRLYTSAFEHGARLYRREHPLPR